MAEANKRQNGGYHEVPLAEIGNVCATEISSPENGATEETKEQERNSLLLKCTILLLHEEFF